MWPFDGNQNAHVALGENEFITSGVAVVVAGELQQPRHTPRVSGACKNSCSLKAQEGVKEIH